MTLPRPVTERHAQLFQLLQRQLISIFPTCVCERLSLEYTDEPSRWVVRDTARRREVLKLFPGSRKILRWWCIGAGHRAVQLYDEEDFGAMLVACVRQYVGTQGLSGEGSRPLSDKVHMCIRALDLVDQANTFRYHVVQTHNWHWSVRWVHDGGRISQILTADLARNQLRQFVGGEPTTWEQFDTWEQVVLRASQVMENFRPNRRNNQQRQPIDDQPPHRPRAAENVPSPPPISTAFGPEATPPPPPPPPANPTVTHDGVIPARFVEQALGYEMLITPRPEENNEGRRTIDLWLLADSLTDQVLGKFYFRTYKALMIPRGHPLLPDQLTEFQFRTGEDFDRGLSAYIDYIGGQLESERRALDAEETAEELQRLRHERRVLQARTQELIDELDQLRPRTDPDGGRRRHIDFG